MIFAVLLDSAEPQRVGAPGQRAEQQIQRLTIDGIGHVVGSRQPCDVIVVHGLHAPERAWLLVTARVDADGADMRKMHERSREIVLALAIPAPQTSDSRRMDGGVRHVAPILVGKPGLVFASVLEVGAQRPGEQQHADNTAADDERQRKNASAVRLVAPVLFFFQHRVQTVFPLMQRRAFGRQVR